MWWFRLLGPFLIVGILAGCGYRPLYGKHSAAPTLQALASVEIDTIEDRRGQMLRNRLLTLMNPQGEPTTPRYRLATTLNESINNRLKREAETTTNADLRLTADFKLYDLKSRQTLLSGTSKSTSSYDVIDSAPYKLAAERDARQKAVKLLAEDIKARIAAFLLNPSKPRQEPEVKKGYDWSQ